MKIRHINSLSEHYSLTLMRRVVKPGYMVELPEQPLKFWEVIIRVGDYVLLRRLND